MIRKNIIKNKYWSFFLLMLFFLATVINIQIRQANRAIHRDENSGRIYTETRNLLIDVIDIEDGMRGFLISGKREYLQPYYRGVSQFAYHLHHLESYLRYAGESAPIGEIEALVRSVTTEATNQVSAMEDHGFVEAQRRFIKYPTKAPMDRIREILGKIQDEEYQKMRKNIDQLDQTTTSTTTLLNVACLVFFFLFAAMITGIISPPSGHPGPKA